MAGLVGVLLSIIASWNVRPLRKIRDSAIFITALPLALLLAAAYAGGWSWRAKLVLIEFELAWATVAVLVIAARRLPLAAEIGVAIAAASKTVYLADVAEAYLRFVASILAAEIFAGLITLWAPVHGDIILSLLGLFIGIGWLVYWLWTQEPVEWWEKTVKFTLVLSLVAVASGLLIPYLMPETTSGLVAQKGAPDKIGSFLLSAITSFVSGIATPIQAFWAVVVLFAIASAFGMLVKTSGRRIAWFVRVVALTLLVYWFIWGAGYTKAKEWVSGKPATTAAVSATPLGLQRIEVLLKPSETRRLDEWPNPLIPPGFSIDFEVVKGNVFLSSGGGEPKPIEGKGVRFPWRSPMVLSGDGTVALLLYRH